MYSCQRVAALIKRSPLPKHVLPCITSQGYCDTSNNGNVAASRKKLPYHSRVVVCGGGIVGCSIAYHLTMMGEDDVVVLEKNRIGEGATSYSAGIVGQLKSTAFETRAIQYTIELYKSLSEEHGLNWVKSGALFLARTPDRLHKLERHHQTARYIGTETQLLCKDEMAEKYPYIGGDDLLGSLWIPEDIIVHSQQITPLLRKLAEQNGATFIEDCSLLSVHTDKHRRVVTSLDTSEGEIKCDYFINAAGQWARMVGKLSTPRVRVPIHSVEHYYMLAQPQDVIDENMPVIRDYDNHCYFRMWGNSIMAGAFEAVAKPIFHDGVPETFNCAKDRLKEDWDQLQFTLDKVVSSIPQLSSACIKDVVTGTEAFSPDRHWILGEAPELKNYFLAAGFCGAGTAASGGIGKKIAELVLGDDTNSFSGKVDVKRFVDLHNNIKYLRDRVKEVVGFDYGAEGASPDRQYESARGLRVSPLHTRAVKLDAAFGETVGYERVMYFHSNSPDITHDESLNRSKTTYGQPKYFDIVKAEYKACREAVALIDMSSFSKVEIRSDNTEELVDFLQYVCANDVDKPAGTVIHTGMLNHNGTYENDCSLFRESENRYLSVSLPQQQTQTLWWLNKQLPQGSSIQISDITSMYTVINVIGPKARELIGELTDVSLKIADFPQMSGKPLYVANAGGVIAMRLTHSHEDGFLLYILSEYSLHVYDTLMEVGRDYGVRNAGYFALRSLRTEWFFAYWGTDLTSQVTPLECGRDQRCKLSSGMDFIGRDALMRQRQEGIKKKFVMLTLDDHDIATDNFPWQGEPILRNGKYVGNVTSSSYGYTLERQVCLGYITNCESADGTVTMSYITDKTANYQVAIGNKLFSATMHAYPPKIVTPDYGFYHPSKKMGT